MNFIADTLQEVRLPVISTEECRKRTIFLPLYKITDNMFCAGYDRGGRDACLVCDFNIIETNENKMKNMNKCL